jgi:hypothetical protein
VDEAQLGAVLGRQLVVLDGLERKSRVLRGLTQAPTTYRLGEGLAVAAHLEGGLDMPLELPSFDAPLSQPLAARADMVWLRRRGGTTRLRAFYLSSGVTLALHSKRPWLRRSGLHRGAATLRRLHDRGALALPLPLEQGRGLSYAWTVERLVAGRPSSREEWPALVPRLVDGLLPIWATDEIESKPARDVVAAREMEAGLRLLREGSWSDSATLPVDRLEAAEALSGRLFVGLCHGDPVPENVIQLADNRLGLIDWEASGQRPIAHDSIKILRWLEDPLPAAEAIGERVVERTGLESADWREQLAIETLRALARSARQHGHALKRDGARQVAGLERRQADLVRLLVQLLSAAG